MVAPVISSPVSAGAMVVPDDLALRRQALRTSLAEMGRVVVCFSGGVDSAYLLAEAVDVLGERAVALTAVSPSLAPSEGEDARRIAEGLGARHLLTQTVELDDPRYAANGPTRCYFCKTELYQVAWREAEARQLGQVVDGFNLDDRGDHRPGRKAAVEQGVRSPLDEAGFTKAHVRAGARALGLDVWDKPALACLSSRFPYGTEITPERLSQVARAEAVLTTLGFRGARVRYHGPLARIEVPEARLEALLAVREAVVEGVKAAGFLWVSMDLTGYRSGALNEALR